MKKRIYKVVGLFMAAMVAVTGVRFDVGNKLQNTKIVYADENLTYTEGNSTYTYINLGDGTVSITDYEGTDTKITIPEEIDGKKVTVIGYRAFDNCKNLVEIILAKGVTRICNESFWACSELENIIIQDNLATIDDFAFGDCNKLKQIVIPKSVNFIGYSVFVGCNSLEEIQVSKENQYYTSESGVLFNKNMTSLVKYPEGKNSKKYIIPEGVTRIGANAFEMCSNLEEIIIPNGLESIEEEAFIACSGLKEIFIPASVKSIFLHYYGPAFSGCSSLERIEVSKENQYYTSESGVLFKKDMTVLYQYPIGKNIEKYTIPDTVRNINYYAFSECKYLEEITIPNKVTSLFSYAFGGCSSLKEIEIPDGVEKIGEEVFSGCSSLKKIDVSEGNNNYTSELGVLFNNDMTKLIQYPDGKESRKYIIPDTVSDIQYGVFNGCIMLEEIEVREENNNYKSEAGVLFDKNMTTLIRFPRGKKDTKYTIPKSVKEVSSLAFWKCSNLKEITILESVTNIQCVLFYHCPNLTIYGKKDSYAETYAKENNIPFIAIEEKTSSDNITISYLAESIQGTISLQTKKITQEDEEYKNIKFEDKIIDSSLEVEDVIFTAYDISLVDENNNKVQPSQVVTVKIPYIEGYDKEKSNIYRVNEDGTFTNMKAKYEDGYLVFETNHFSTYVITETELLSNLDVLLGDVNEDGEINIKDSALIKRYLAGLDVEMNEVPADVNGDGEINIKDSALIKRYLAGWDVEFVG